jgi:cell division transport system ATP-binding protein
MLSINKVDFRYQNVEIFNNLNFEMDPGDFVFLIGKSGSGKSTLLQLINMNLLPHAGYVQFLHFNSSLIKSKELPLLRRKIGFVFQDFKLLKDRNIYENLRFILSATGTSTPEIRKRINNVLTDVGLSHRRYAMPDELSGGEKQRIAIARAIINNPVLILADEPTGNLDPETSSEIIDIIVNINKQGTAVLFATHNYEIIKKNDYKIYKLENGRALKAVIKQKQF